MGNDPPNHRETITFASHLRVEQQSSQRTEKPITANFSSSLPQQGRRLKLYPLKEFFVLLVSEELYDLGFLHPSCFRIVGIDWLQ
jgi:hypothetical protein